jgi:hypothetical protein
MVQERRGMLRVWNLSLLCATFSLTILETFLTRSGVLDSVHSFSESDIGPWLLAFLGAGFSPLSKDEFQDPCDPQRVLRFGETVKRGLQWLIARQDPEGCIGDRGMKYMYNHCVAALAISEAYGMTASAPTLVRSVSDPRRSRPLQPRQPPPPSSLPPRLPPGLRRRPRPRLNTLGGDKTSTEAQEIG